MATRDTVYSAEVLTMARRHGWSLKFLGKRRDEVIYYLIGGRRTERLRWAASEAAVPLVDAALRLYLGRIAVEGREGRHQALARARESALAALDGVQAMPGGIPWHFAPPA